MEACSIKSFTLTGHRIVPNNDTTRNIFSSRTCASYRPKRSVAGNARRRLLTCDSGAGKHEFTHTYRLDFFSGLYSPASQVP